MVSITCTLTVGSRGEVTIRHEIDGIDFDGRADKIGLFGFPGEEIAPAKLAEVVRNLPRWVIERYREEKEAAARLALAAVEASQKPQQAPERKAAR
jgi:hypothetical protein